eukprot:3640128-Rhodomonas_salina.1
MPKIRARKGAGGLGGAGGKKSGRSRDKGKDDRNPEYTFPDQNLYVVRRVIDWRINVRTSELEWLIDWTIDDSTSWEPNCNASGYSRSIVAFLRTVTGPPPLYEE